MGDDSRALGAAAAVAAMIWHPVPGLATSVPLVRRPLGVVDRIAAEDAVALTFDDGPHPEGTPAILEILAAHEAVATFFLAGEQVQRWPGLARRIADAGHPIALHCHQHVHALRCGPRRLERDLVRGFATIADATGCGPVLYRPPFGVLSASALAIARRRGWRPTLWTRWGRDWEARATPASIARLATRRLRGRDIVLLHDADHYSAPGSHERTAGALPLIFAGLRRLGLRTAPVDA